MGAPVAWLALVVLVGGARGEVPVPRCPPAAAERCRKLGAGPNEYYFNVDDLNFIYSYSDGNYLSLKCPREGIGPEDPALPRFEPELVVGKVSVECPLPAAPYTAVLRAINVAPPARLIVKGGRLLRAHLADAALLRSLDLIGVELEPGALAAAARLTALYVEKVNLTGGELERLPAGLAALHLRQTGVGLVSRDALRRLPALETLLVRGERDVRLQTDAAAALRSLSVTANKARLDPRLPPTLENVTVGGWTPERPEPWAACAGLVRLTLDKPDAAELPAGWVAGCDRLRELEVCDARRPLKLVAGALRGARALRRLRLARCALRELPSGLLDDARDLSYLDLSDNHLLALPSGLLRYSKRSLSALRLSRNLFDGSVLRSLEELASLETLHLNDNEALDACPAPNIANDTIHVPLAPASSLRRLVALRLLALDGTRTARVCSDWRDLPRLRALSLRRSRLAALTYTDLRFASTTDVKIFLCGANVTSLVFEREDYVRVIDPDWARVTVQLDATLVRDCSLYWAAAALRRPGTRVLHKPCATTIGVKLADESLDELVCPRPCRYAANCSCAVREDHAPPGRLLRLDCSGAAHTRVPPLDLHAALDAAPGERYRVDLLLAGNRVADLRPEDLPPDLATLDLRNNSLTLIDAATASTLIRRPELKVLLAGNELECGCDALAALGVVRARPEMFVDRFEATCASGRALAVAAAAPPCAAPVSPLAAAWALVGLAVLAPVALAALALLRPGLRLRLKAALRARGLIPPAPELEDGRRYDAFVSFAHADESVVRELAARLESGAAPLRLCLHYRDWAPGGWIPAQIAASVRESRRTVAVVSAEFLRSAWARAEFREAHAAALRDARPRLVVVLLDEPARLPLDPELRAYLADNTYVRWGDPWFWDKLRRALPTPRPRAPDPPAALPDGGPPAHSPRSPPAA